MKKILTILIAGMMLLTGCIRIQNGNEAEVPAAAEEIQAVPEEAEAAAAEPAEPAGQAAEVPPAEEPAEEAETNGHLTAGGTTPFSGAFSTAMWGNATSDIDIRYLLHGYNLVEWDSAIGGFVVDPSVVSGIVVTDNWEGDRTYTLTLCHDLVYSDGSPIKAADYAFSLLLSMAPEVVQIGGNTANLSYLVGYEDYISGTASYCSGIRVPKEDTIAITVSHEYLPFFYELGLLDCNPYPISQIAPGCTVRDGGYGAYISNTDRTVISPIFTAELLKKTLLDPESGYVTHPSVTSGPYKLVSYDGTTVELELNSRYKGNSAGKKPTIQKLTVTTVRNETMLDDLKNGKVDLLNKVVSAEVLQNGAALSAGQEGFAATGYPRTGLSFISFCCENPLVSDVKIRQAIAMCLDKDGLAAATVDTYGQRVDGYYGLGQWMYSVVSGEQDYPVQDPGEWATAAEKREYERISAGWKALSLSKVKSYALDTAEAGRLLAQAGWTLNREGSRFKAGTDDVRCKRINGELKALELKLLCPEGSVINGALQENLIDHLAEAGILVDMEEKPMPELLQYYYRAEDRDCAMIVMASNFNVVFDPSETFRPDGEEMINRHNATGIDDARLYRYAVDMRQTEPGNPLGYCQKWVQFQKRFQEVVPMIPLYSNDYYDIYTTDLQDYDIKSNVSWSQAIVEARLNGSMGE